MRNGIKRILYVVLFALVGLNSSAQSQPDVTATDVKVRKIEDMLSVSFDLVVGKKAISPNYKLTVVPILYTNSGKKTLPYVTVMGNRMELLQARTDIAAGRKSEVSQMKTKNGTTFRYNFVFPYEVWMNGSSLRLDRILEGCCGSEVLPSEEIARNLIFLEAKKEPAVPHIDVQEKIVIVPKIQEVNKKWEFSREDLTIDFKQAKIEIDYDLFRNREILQEMVNAITSVMKNPNAKLGKIEITGFASPEGTAESNAKLGGMRANALKDYLMNRISGLNDESFKLNNGVENWAGLRKLVAESNMMYRDEVLGIIDNYPEWDSQNKISRKKVMMELHGGTPWRYMMQNFFPKLRNAKYEAVYFDTLGDKAADAINEATSLIAKADYAKALELLKKHSDDSRAWNALGVCYMMVEDYSNAKVFLKKAADQGNENAKQNLKEIEKLVK